MHFQTGRQFSCIIFFLVNHQCFPDCVSHTKAIIVQDIKTSEPLLSVRQETWIVADYSWAWSCLSFAIHSNVNRRRWLVGSKFKLCGVWKGVSQGAHVCWHSAAIVNNGNKWRPVHSQPNEHLFMRSSHCGHTQTHCHGLSAWRTSQYSLTSF